MKTAAYINVENKKLKMRRMNKRGNQSILSNTIKSTAYLLLLLIWCGGGVLHAQTSDLFKDFDRYFDVDNIGNLHVYAPADKYDVKDDYYFKGELLPKKFEGLYADNWRENLPKEMKTFAVSKIRNGEEDAYILRFEGLGTQNMIGLFEVENDLLRFKKRLAYQYCYDYVCFQLDSWIQDFDGDARLDILQKVVVVDSYLKDQVIDEFMQQLRQNEDGDFVPTTKFSINTDKYSHIYFEQ
jgi:hypothetical protein